jgi:hypothetical protein
MNKPSDSDLLNLDCEARYDYFLGDVAENREIWILVNASVFFLKIYSEDENFDYLPIWSNKELASAYAKDSTEPLKPKEISLPEFLKKWIAGLEKDDLMIGVFPTQSDKTVWIMEPGELKDDINDELAQF